MIAESRVGKVRLVEGYAVLRALQIELRGLVVQLVPGVLFKIDDRLLRLVVHGIGDQRIVVEGRLVEDLRRDGFRFG